MPVSCEGKPTLWLWGRSLGGILSVTTSSSRQVCEDIQSLTFALGCPRTFFYFVCYANGVTGDYGSLGLSLYVYVSIASSTSCPIASKFMGFSATLCILQGDIVIWNNKESILSKTDF